MGSVALRICQEYAIFFDVACPCLCYSPGWTTRSPLIYFYRHMVECTYTKRLHFDLLWPLSFNFYRHVSSEFSGNTIK